MIDTSRNTVLALLLAGVLLGPTAAGTDVVRHEGEDGKQTWCGQELGVVDRSDASGGQVLLLGANGCRAFYTHVTGSQLEIRWYMNGDGGDRVCGYWKVVHPGDLTYGTTPTVCKANGNWAKAIADLSVPVVYDKVGVYFQAGHSSPGWVNGYLDFIETTDEPKWGY